MTEETGKSFCVKCSTFDLLKYINRYEGYTKIVRLLWITDHCSNLFDLGTQLLLDELKKGFNVNLYVSICEKAGDMSILDKSWVDATRASFDQTLEHLESELSIFKSSMGKESLRRKYFEMAVLFLNKGIN